MSDLNETNPNPNKPKEWTLMFYFASDNPLAPGVISQLKAIKSAGYHPDANVVTHFEPYNVGPPTHVFDVNIIEKLEDPGHENIGWGEDDPFVRNLLFDRLWRDEKCRDPKILVREQIKKVTKLPYDPPKPPASQDSFQSECAGESGPKHSLGNFLTFCRQYYPAKNYILFILGHGLVVANDVFLYDAHASKHSLTLVELGEVLTKFRQKLDNQDAQFQLISFHSCSLSSAEVAYELRGTANYMLASQSPSFVGSWPYRSILMRIFKDIHPKKPIKETLVNIFYYCLYNSTDFLFGGYSFDLCLCNLNKVNNLGAPMKALSKALINGLRDPLIQDHILLAHWKAQSYWQENYSDLYDFCLCLWKRCKGAAGKKMSGPLKNIYDACGLVMDQLLKETEPGQNHLIARSDYAGPAYQYSHGLSIYFPWTEPSSDIPIMQEYESYEFSETRWFDFLKLYFRETMRKTKKHPSEANHKPSPKPRKVTSTNNELAELLEDIANLVYYSEGHLHGGSALGGGKIGPTDPTGDDCGCPSIKNYPHDTRSLREKLSQAPPEDFVPISSGFFDPFT